MGQRFPAAGLDAKDVRAIAQEAVLSARGRRLSSPAAAAFAVTLRGLHASPPDRSIGETSPEALRYQAEEGLDELAQGASTLGRFDLRVAALYGAVLTKEYEAVATGAHRLPLAVAAQLGAHDRRLMEQYQLYRQLLHGWTLAPWTVESAIERWGRFVQAVADGYPWEDMYTDELDRRDILEDALSMLSPTGRRTLAYRVDLSTIDSSR